MNKPNFDAEMLRIAKEYKEKGVRPKLLMHSCCAPCSTACIERLIEFFDLTIFYYNPNMDTEEEFKLRAEEQKRYCDKLGVKVIIEPYNSTEFYSAVKGMENLSEGGERCFICYRLRLNKTAEVAKSGGFDFFTTTLTVSPLKNAEKLNEIGKDEGDKIGVKFLPSDFKKQGGYLRSITLSKENNMYRQNYCGCIFSKRQSIN